MVTNQRSLEGLAGEVAPQRAGLAVEHDERVADQLAGNAKGKGLAVDVSGIHDARVAKRSPGDGDVFPAQAIVDDLDPAHEGNGVRVRLTCELDPDDGQVFPYARFVRRNKMGIVDRSNGVGRENGLDLRAAERIGTAGWPQGWGGCLGSGDVERN